MMKSLPVASDLTCRSKRAVRRAVKLAQQADAALRDVHRVEDHLPEHRMREEIRSAEGCLMEQAVGLGQSQAEVILAIAHALNVMGEQASRRAGALRILS